MNKEYSSEVKFYKVLRTKKASVYVDVERRQWPWWEIDEYFLFYFHPFVFFRAKFVLGCIGFGIQIRIGGN